MAHNPPFVVPVQIDPMLNEFVPLFTGYVLDCIISTASQNQARNLFKQLMEQDQNALQEVVQTLANVVEFFVVSENLQPNQVEVAIRNSVELVVNAYLAMAVNAYPQEFGQVIDANQQADVQNYIRALEDVKFQAQRFFQGGNTGFVSNQRTGWQPQRGGGGWGRGTGGGRTAATRTSRWDEPDQGGTQWQAASRDNWPGNRMAGGNTAWAGRGTSGRSTIWDDTGRKATPTDASYNGAAAGGRVARTFENPRARNEPAPRNVQPIVANQKVVDGVTFIPVNDKAEWPKVKDRNRIWDWILLENGIQIRPAYQSDWKVSFDKDEPGTPWYDPETHILFHYKSPEGVVSLEAIKREDTMGYLDHELDPELRRKGEAAAREAEGKMAPAWQMVTQLRPNPSSPLATAEPLYELAEGEQVEVVNPDAYLATTSLSDAIKRTCLRLKVDRPEVLKQAFELYIDVGVLTTIVNPNFEQLFELANTGTYKQLFDAVMDIKDGELVKEINERMAASITTALQKNMGLSDWAITNFVEDYGDLVQALKEDHGDTVLQIFESYAIEVISRALAHYSENELDEVVRDAVGLSDDVTALVWRERCSVTRLPVNAADLRVPADTGVLVSPTRFPEIHQTLSSILGRTVDIPVTFFGRYIATEDGVIYSVSKGHLNEQAILLYKAPFTLK